MFPAKAESRSRFQFVPCPGQAAEQDGAKKKADGNCGAVQLNGLPEEGCSARNRHDLQGAVHPMDVELQAPEAQADKACDSGQLAELPRQSHPDSSRKASPSPNFLDK